MEDMDIYKKLQIIKSVDVFNNNCYFNVKYLWEDFGASFYGMLDSGPLPKEKILDKKDYFLLFGLNTNEKINLFYEINNILKFNSMHFSVWHKLIYTIGVNINLFPFHENHFLLFNTSIEDKMKIYDELKKILNKGE